MSEVKNEMVEAAVAHLELSPYAYTYRTDDDADWMTLNGHWDIREMLAAALAAAPTVEDAVVCGAHPDGWLVMPDGCGQRDCPGPHHTLLLGAEVTS
jgi:hypothetical protein